jgi:ABC-2 type transport system permease protein
VSEAVVAGHHELRVRVPARGPRADAGAVAVVWRREMITSFRNKLRFAMALVQPLLFLFVLGGGLQGVATGSIGDFSFKTFLFPGVLATAVFMPALFSAGSIVFDREFGFMREMMVAPIRRATIVIGKCVGGATVATIQGLLVLCLAGAVHVPYDPAMLASLVGEIALFSLALVSFGVMLAAGITQFMTFQAVMQTVMFPLIFLSGTLFPQSGLPRWLEVVTRLDPVSYAVDALRGTVFRALDAPARARHVLDPGIDWWGWKVPIGVELGIVALSGLVMLAIAIRRFEAIE